MSPEREATAAMAPAECTGAACRPRFWRESIHVRVKSCHLASGRCQNYYLLKLYDINTSLQFIHTQGIQSHIHANISFDEHQSLSEISLGNPRAVVVAAA
jgi:hypothetical protein